MSDFYYPVRQDELYHYGVPGMKWGIVRSKKTLAKKSAKLAKKNDKLSNNIKKYEKLEKDYTVKSNKNRSKNMYWQRELNEAKTNKAYYESRLAGEMNKRVPKDRKIAKYNKYIGKEYERIKKSESKLYNRWDDAIEDVKAKASVAKDKIDHNTSLKNMYDKTIDALDAGTVKKGRFFMQYVVEY